MKTPITSLLYTILTARSIGTRCVAIGFVFLLLIGCGKKNTEQQNVSTERSYVEKEIIDLLDQNVTFEIVKDKSKLDSYYELPLYKEWYEKRILPPKFDYSVDLSNKSYMELRLLRNEIYARNGYLFNDAVLRAHFNQFPWYQPIFDLDTFIVQLTEQEKVFLDRVVKHENERLKDKYVTVDRNKMVNVQHVVNLIQFQEVDKSLLAAVKKMNFAIAAADNDQLFYVYDRNQYDYIPNFITTDLILQVLHKYLSSLMQEIEEQKLISLVGTLLKNLHDKSNNTVQTITDPTIREASIWANTYLAIALTALYDTPVSVDSSMVELYNDEIEKIRTASGSTSDFLERTIFDYSQFKPRGNYTKSDSLQRYFRCIKWLNSATMNIGNETTFNAAVLISYWINSDRNCRNDFSALNDIITLLVGEEDNSSISHLIRIQNELRIDDVEQLLSLSNTEKIKNLLESYRSDRIQPKAGNDIARKEFSKKHILFTAGRYTFDSEILVRLIHVLRPNPMRPFPKGLDIFASLGNQTAEEILLKEYKEADKWPAFADSLSSLKIKFGEYSNWNNTIHDKTMECINALNFKINNDYPIFMQTHYWQKKNLNTSLAAWTELKHDMILYSEQAGAAEAGEGGGPPPPVHLSYVEPNINFWEKTLELLNFQERSLSELGVLTDDSKKINSELKELIIFLLEISRKEIRKENLTKKEFSELTWIGGKIEYLTFDILHSSHLPDREKQIALVADVYTYNEMILEEAVGKADEIYVVAEINGLPYLTKGACFSYYEFQSNKRLTDEEWQQGIAAGKVPERSIWLKEIYVKTKSLVSKPEYNEVDFIQHGVSDKYVY